jgi:hypothetical protein
LDRTLHPDAVPGAGVRRTRLQLGERYNPFGLFNGIWVPEALVRCKTISAGAKLAFGRLARYAGHDGRCYPAVSTLGREIGVGARQAQKYLSELERAGLIRRVSRFEGPGQSSNDIEFLWHPLFEEGVNDRSGEGVNDSSSRGVNDRSPKESHIEESHSEETNDLDCPITNRKKRDSRPGVMPSPSRCRQYPQVREALAQYMMASVDDERIYPQDRHVVDVMDAAQGATEDQVMRCLQYLYKERGLRPGTANGPRHFSWFPTVVGEYFRTKREREGGSYSTGYDQSSRRNGADISTEELTA